MTPAASTVARDPRRLNRSRVLSALRFHDLGGRAEIAAFTGLTEAAVSRITRELIDAGVLTEFAARQLPGRSAGRPLVQLGLVGGSAFVLAFEIAANAQSVSLVDVGGALVRQQPLDLLQYKNPALALQRAAQAALQLLARSAVPMDRVVGAGVAIAGAVDALAGAVISAPNIGWKAVAVAAPLASQLGLPVRVESRASALLLAERRLGVARGANSVLLINLALGIGGALMMDGRLVRGRQHGAGQIAHMPMPGAGAACLCGRVGCLDTLASGRAILGRLGRLSAPTDMARHGAADALALRAMADEAADGKTAALAAFRAAGEHLGNGLRWAEATLQPDLIVLAGVPAHCQAYLDGVRYSYADPAAAPLAVSHIANETAAGELALDAFVYSHGFDLA